MQRITIEEMPEDLHAQLAREAKANFRSIDQEVLARLQRSFELEDRLMAKRVDQLIDEAIASGPEEDISREHFDAARQRARDAFARRRKAA
jgi:hypothetical protein